MMPRHSHYGGWPRSGEIDIMESRGNCLFHISWTLNETNSTFTNVIIMIKIVSLFKEDNDYITI